MYWGNIVPNDALGEWEVRSVAMMHCYMQWVHTVKTDTSTILTHLYSTACITESPPQIDCICLTSWCPQRPSLSGAELRASLWASLGSSRSFHTSPLGSALFTPLLERPWCVLRLVVYSKRGLWDFPLRSRSQIVTFHYMEPRSTQRQSFDVPYLSLKCLECLMTTQYSSGKGTGYLSGRETSSSECGWTTIH